MTETRIPFEHLFRAFIWASITGGVAFGVQFLIPVLFEAELDMGLSYIVIGIITLACPATLVFLIGMILVAWPVWSILHRWRARSPWAGAIAGAVCASLAQWALSDRLLPPLVSDYMLALPGAAAGYVAWWMIYNRPIRPLPPPPPAPPS